MEDQMKPTLHNKRALWDSTGKRDVKGVDHQKCRYERDESSRREMSEKRASSQSTTKQKRQKGDQEKREITGRQNILDKQVFYTRFNAYEEKKNLLINSRKEICSFLKSIGIDDRSFLKDFTRKIEILMKDIKTIDYNQELIIFGKLELFLEHYLQRNIIQVKHKTTEPPKVIRKFRPLQPVVTRETKIDESEEEFTKNTIISNIIVIHGGILTYSRHCMTISVTRQGDRIDVPCPSSVTDFTRIGKDIVLATLPFQKMILIISPISFKIKRIDLGLYLVSYVEHSTLIGVEMFGKTVYQIDWEGNRILNEFITKETPTDIAVGAQNILLITFFNVNRIICYKLDGQQLWEIETHSLHLPSKISLYQNYFYVLQGQIIYRISAKGGVTKRDIGRKCHSISVGKGTILVTDYCGKPHAIKTNKDFWTKLSYSHQLHTPSFKDYIYIEDCDNIINILPMSKSSMLIIYQNNNVKVFSDIGEIITQNNLVFPELPSFSCRINANRFLVFYHEMKGFQYITYPELRKGPLIKIQTDYMEICHIVLNKCLAVTTIENKSEVHILLIKEDKVYILKRISLGHCNVTIAATPINFIVVDGRENKMVFYSTCGEELFQKYLPFYGYPHHICSDNVYFYVLFKRNSILICYDIYGEIKWQWNLPFPVHSHIAVFQGTFYVPDIELNRVLLYKDHKLSSGCCLHTKNPYIRNLDIRLKEKENAKVVIGKICHLPNGQSVVSDTNHDCLLYISNEGDIVSRLSLPSTATDICRWDSNHISVTLPLQKQLRVIGNLSKTVRSVSLSEPYVRVCKMGECEIVCYCDKPSHLDILAIKYSNQVERIHRINIPFFVKSLSIDKKTQKLLIVTRRKAFQYNTRIGGSGHGGCQMVPSVLMSQVKRPPNLYGGSIDPMFVYLIDNSRMFAINDHNLLVNDLVTNNQLNYYIDLVDVFSRKICVSEMLSSSLHLQDLSVSDKGRHIPLPQHLGDKKPVQIGRFVITENNLIAGCDKENGNIKIFTLDGQLLDSIKQNFYTNIEMCRWQSNTLVITNWDSLDVNEYQLLTLKLEFPLSLVIYQSRSNYKCLASLSNNQLVFNKMGDECHLYFVEIDEIHSNVNEIKQVDIPETLTKNIDENYYYDSILDIDVTTDDVIIVFNRRFVIFFNSDGQYLYSVRHYMVSSYGDDKMTIDDSFLYIYGQWEKYYGSSRHKTILCLTQNGEYNKVFLNERIYKRNVLFSSIDCEGPRFVGSHWRITWNELYVEGLFMVNRESFPVARLQTDECRVEVKDFDISDEGKTVVCEKSNNGNVKIFDEDGELLCHRNVASLVGGVCFTQEKHIMATVPKTKQIFQLNGEDLKKSKVWSSVVPYGVIWRKVGSIYWCQHIELIECHCIKIDGDQVNILESVSLLNLDSGLCFPSITNKEIFSNELINKLESKGENGEGGRRRGKTGEIIGKSRLKVRCGNYMAEIINNSGIDEISVRRLPYRTAMVPFLIPAFEEPFDYDLGDIRDWRSKLIKLDENVSVLIFRESVTLIGTTTGDILQQEQQQQPLDICRWTDECFIVAFGREMIVFNRDLCCLKTIKTEKYYNTIYKYNDNQLVCGGHYISDVNEEERDKKYRRIWRNNKDYYICKDPDIFDSYYVDVVDFEDGECKDEVCGGETRRCGRLEGEAVVDDVGVTSFGDVVVVRWETEEMEVFGWWDDFCFVEWFRKKSLVRRIRMEEGKYFDLQYNIPRPHLTINGECVYVTDAENNIYEIPGDIEEKRSEGIEILRLEDNPKYLLLRWDDNEVFEALGFDISQNSFMVFGIIPGCQSFAFFHYEK